MTTSPFSSRYDAVIVGARPAGAGTALLLARAGLRVLVIDRGRHGADTLSTHALMRAGVMQLARWGVLPRIAAAGTPPVTQATFVYSGDATTVAVKPATAWMRCARRAAPCWTRPSRMPPCRRVHRSSTAPGWWTCCAAAAVPCAASSSRPRTDEVITSSAPLVIGADGLRSAVARLVGASPTRTGRWAAATVFGYWEYLPVDGYRWHYHPGVSSGAIPTNDGLTCVFASIPATSFASVFKSDIAAGYRQVVAAASPDIADALPTARLHGSLHGFAGHVGRFCQSTGPGWALVGDAAYFKDPITAHGITDALIDAELLARAVVDGRAESLAGYEDARNRRAENLFDVTDRLASFAWTLDEARALHRTLSEEMSREAKMVTGWAAEAVTA
ncbi:MAG: NAD(P)/FAD-dependent oxidoreductase [Vicinamibacterales bacterium]